MRQSTWLVYEADARDHHRFEETSLTVLQVALMQSKVRVLSELCVRLTNTAIFILSHEV